MVAGVLQRFAFVAGIPPALASAPRVNLTDDPYFTDGLRLFIQLNGRGTGSPEEAGDWVADYCGLDELLAKTLRSLRLRKFA
jgi:hypothetical protein